MKLKYFMRGFGVGIVFASLILIAAYMTNPNKVLTDEEIMSRAMELGMVKEDTKLDQLLNEEKDSSDDTTGGATDDTAEATSEDTTDETTDDTTEVTSEDATEDTTDDTTEATSEDTTESTTEDEEEVVTANIVVRAGMQSIRVARLLEEHKIIKDADDFDAYLVRHGYSTKIRVGTYTLKSTYSYEQLAKILTGRQ